MKKSIFLLILSIIILAPAVFSITLWDLINFFNFDFFTTKINVIGYDDFMNDTDGDSVNDTLYIELTTDGSAGTYLFVVDLYDETIIKNETNKTLSSGINKFNITFSTDFLTKNRFNYTIKIYEENYSLKHSKESTETKSYGKYKQGIMILNITDNSINNNTLQINLTLNSTKSKTYEIVTYLKYNNSIIFSKINYPLNSGSNNLLINFSNETIKNTHYAGKFNLTSIKIDNKVIKTDYLTNLYDYKDFAQSSYFTNISDYGFDSDNDELFDDLYFNISMQIKNSGSYKIKLALYDSFGNFIDLKEKTKILEAGENSIIISIRGKIMYKKKFNGPFIVRYVKLIKNNVIIDQIDDFHTTDYYDYTNFETPDLPDLNVSIDVSDDYHYGKNNITFNTTIKNEGNESAFNVFLEIFDNYTFERNESSNILSTNGSLKYTTELTNISDIELNAIADFNDFIEESNESNNILKKIIKINKKPILEEIGNLTVNENDLITITANATDNNSDNLTYSTNNSKLSQNNNIFSWQTTTDDAGGYTAMINISDGYLHDSKIFQITVLNVPAISASSGNSGSGGTSLCAGKWDCTSWSNCIDNEQTRICNDLNNCKTTNKPIEIQQCSETEAEEQLPEEKENKKVRSDEKIEDKAKYSLPAITGYLLNPPENANMSIGTLIVSVITITGLFGYFYFLHKP